jgi:hypothetical protein
MNHSRIILAKLGMTDRPHLLFFILILSDGAKLEIIGLVSRACMRPGGMSVEEVRGMLALLVLQYK